MVFDPFAVPPFCRVDGHSLQKKPKMQMIPSGQASSSTPAQHILLLQLLANLHTDRAQMSVQRSQPTSVIDQHGIAVDAKIVCQHDHTVVRSLDGILLGYGEIETDVVLPVDFLTLVDI